MTEATTWKWFSKFIRLRDSECKHGASVGRCCTCGNPIVVHDGYWNASAHAGHFISRDRKSTKYDEQNVHLQCHHCNTFKGGRQFDHSLFIDKKYGEGTAEKINIKSRQLCKRNRYDLQQLADYYRKQAKQIAKERNIKL